MRQQNSFQKNNIENKILFFIQCENSGSFETPDNLFFRRKNECDIEELLTSCTHEPTTMVMVSAKDQVEFLRRCIGLNISEIAEILHVKRPTIYEWIDDKEPSTPNQARLAEVYKVCLQWKKTNIGRMQSYLHKALFDNKSLFNLLCEKKINTSKIKVALSEIERAILFKKQQQEEHEKLLEKHGFKKPTKEELRAALERMTWTIS